MLAVFSTWVLANSDLVVANPYDVGAISETVGAMHLPLLAVS